MGEGIQFAEIKKALKHNRKLSRKDEGGYEKDENDWKLHGVYDTSIIDFSDSLSISLPENFEKERDIEGYLKNPEIFQIYIEQTLSKEQKHDLTAIEFGGPGSELFRGFSKDFFKKTVGVCLKDIRDPNEKNNDIKNNHSVVEGDILDIQDDKLLNEVTEKLDTEKTDLIISRMIGPLKEIDKHPAILDRIIRNWYNMLNENGLMFIQFQGYVPLNKDKLERDLMEKWSTIIKEKFPKINIQIDGGVMRLHKKVGAPEELPRASELFRE